MASTTETKVHSFEEVKKHKDRNDCWLLIHGKVYDVTSFLDDHPGGDEVLLAATEKDASEDFDDVGHSDSAKEEMQKYYIGEVDSTTVPAAKKYNPPPRGGQKREESGGGGGFVVKILQFLVPLLILGLAFGLRYYGQKKAD